VSAAGIARVVAGMAFLAAGAGKLASERTVRFGPLLLGEAPGPIAFAGTVVEDALPGLEVLIGAAYLAGLGRRVRTAGAGALGAAFVGAAAAIPEGVRCACFGALGGFEGRPGHLAAAGVLSGIVFVAWRLESRDEARKALAAKKL
jgi:hypothetical protein